MNSGHVGWVLTASAARPCPCIFMISLHRQTNHTTFSTPYSQIAFYPLNPRLTFPSRVFSCTVQRIPQPSSALTTSQRSTRLTYASTTEQLTAPNRNGHSHAAPPLPLLSPPSSYSAPRGSSPIAGLCWGSVESSDLLAQSGREGRWRLGASAIVTQRNDRGWVQEGCVHLGELWTKLRYCE